MRLPPSISRVNRHSVNLCQHSCDIGMVELERNLRRFYISNYRSWTPSVQPEWPKMPDDSDNKPKRRFAATQKPCFQTNPMDQKTVDTMLETRYADQLNSSKQGKWNTYIECPLLSYLYGVRSTDVHQSCTAKVACISSTPSWLQLP